MRFIKLIFDPGTSAIQASKRNRAATMTEWTVAFLRDQL